MNVLLWIVQIVLALLAFAGGSYKVFAVGEVLKVPAGAAFPAAVWIALGVFEVVCAVLLIVPAATKRMPVLTTIAAAALTVENVGLAVVDARYSVEVAATNPLVWVVGMAVIAAFVTIGRFALRTPR